MREQLGSWSALLIAMILLAFLGRLLTTPYLLEVLLTLFVFPVALCAVVALAVSAFCGTSTTRK